MEAGTAEAQQITIGINAWEWRWPHGSFVTRNASVLSQSALERHARSQAEYAALLARRDAPRAAYAALAGQVDEVISVVVPGSKLGAPGVSLPV